MYFEWFERSPMLAWTQSPVTASEHQVTANLGSQSQAGITYHLQLSDLSARNCPLDYIKD